MTVLTMAFLAIENRRDLPKVSYSTALDIFVGVCFAFVLATILQFAGVHFFTKHGSGEVFLIPESSSSGSEGEEEEQNAASATSSFASPYCGKAGDKVTSQTENEGG